MFVYKRGKSRVTFFAYLPCAPNVIVAIEPSLKPFLRALMESYEMLMSPLLDNRKERVQFDKITARVSRLCYGLDADHVDAAAITQKVISGVYQGVTTVELDNLVSTRDIAVSPKISYADTYPA